MSAEIISAVSQSTFSVFSAASSAIDVAVNGTIKLHFYGSDQCCTSIVFHYISITGPSESIEPRSDKIGSNG